MPWFRTSRIFTARRKDINSRLCTLLDTLLIDISPIWLKTTKAHQICTCCRLSLFSWQQSRRNLSCHVSKSWSHFYLNDTEKVLRDNNWSIWKRKSWELLILTSIMLVLWNSLKDINVYYRLTSYLWIWAWNRFTTLPVNCASTCSATLNLCSSRLPNKHLQH